VPEPAPDVVYLTGLIVVNAPAPDTTLLGPNAAAVAPPRRLITVGLALSTLFAMPRILPVPLARTAKLVLPSISVLMMDAILTVPCTFTPPALNARNESLMKARPPLVLTPQS
jgi:hypothetical protein